MKILITGGASGLGESITRRIAQNSEHVVYFTFSSSESNARKIERDHSNASAFKCDFKMESDVDLLCANIEKWEIDVLINNAYSGEFIKTHFHKTDHLDFLNDFNHNIIPTVKVTQSVINCFRKKKSGKIITILTAALINTPPVGSSVYVANKAYLHELTKIWAVENSKFNISSNSVSPAFMLTGLTKDMDERLIEQITEAHPLKKLLTTGEVAESVMFLLTASPQINGVNLILNAGSNVI